MSTCESCNGTGIINKDDKMYECQCSFLFRIKSFIPKFILRSEVTIEHIHQMPVKNPFKNYYISCYFPDFKSILKCCMIRYSNKSIKVTSDKEIVDVFVGSRSKNSKSDVISGPIYNCIEDLVSPPDILVIKLNELVYKNKAASSALEEAIICRIEKDRPVWIFSDKARPFCSTSSAYSDSVYEQIANNFIDIKIPQILKRAVDSDAFSVSIPKNTEPDQKSTTERESRRPDESYKNPPTRKPDQVFMSPDDFSDIKKDDSNDDMSVFGSGRSKKKKW